MGFNLIIKNNNVLINYLSQKDIGCTRLFSEAKMIIIMGSSESDLEINQRVAELFKNQVHCLDNGGAYIKFLIPPDQNNNEWQIYRLNSSPETSAPDLESLKREPNKEKVATTLDILAYLNDPQKAYITNKLEFNPVTALLEINERRAARQRQTNQTTTTTSQQLPADPTGKEKEIPKANADAAAPTSVPSPKN